jgi:hypothetical protein
MAEVERRIAEGASSKDLSIATRHYRRIVARDAPGFELLLRRFGGWA